MKRHLLTFFSKNGEAFVFVMGMLHFSSFLLLCIFAATYAFNLCVELINQSDSPQARYNTTHIWPMFCNNTCICFHFSSEKTCFNYREVDLEGGLFGVPHTWYISGQSFITRLKLDKEKWECEKVETYLKRVKNCGFEQLKKNVSVCRGHELANAPYHYTGATGLQIVENVG